MNRKLPEYKSKYISHKVKGFLCVTRYGESTSHFHEMGSISKIEGEFHCQLDPETRKHEDSWPISTKKMLNTYSTVS